MSGSGSQTQREEVCRVAHSLFARGYVHATAGNISVRVPAQQGGGILITPTDACLGFLEPDDLVWIGPDGAPRGPGRPSKTVVLHDAIYRADPQAACIIHTHSTHTVALTLLEPWQAGRDLLGPITPYFVMKVGHVPRIAYHRPGDPAVAQAVTLAIDQATRQGLQLRAVMLDRLGPNVWHRSPAEAMAALEELEETARLWLLARQTCTPLDDTQIQALRDQFGASW